MFQKFWLIKILFVSLLNNIKNKFMCEKKLTKISTNELILELAKRGLFTSSKTNENILKNLYEESTTKLIITKGLPKENLECRECRQTLESDEFTYYLCRVDKNGYLMRSNAMCHNCIEKSNKTRKKVLKNVSDPKPKKGDTCKNCNRLWFGNWHRHHVGDSFIGWLCGHCNMSFSDQRNKCE